MREELVLVAKGTTAISTDFYEYGIFAGAKAIRFALDEMKQTPLKVLFTLPLHHYLSPGPCIYLPAGSDPFPKNW